jgi:hypothetical protein
VRNTGYVRRKKEFKVRKYCDYTGSRRRWVFLEGTGSLLLDRQ